MELSIRILAVVVVVVAVLDVRTQVEAAAEKEEGVGHSPTEAVVAEELVDRIHIEAVGHIPFVVADVLHIPSAVKLSLVDCSPSGEELGTEAVAAAEEEGGFHIQVALAAVDVKCEAIGNRRQQQSERKDKQQFVARQD